jgi:large subunit ribosomal protein L7A
MDEQALKSARAFCAGVKQCSQAVAGGKAKKAYIASDADGTVTAPFAALCAAHGVAALWVPEKARLGKVCGLKVDASCAVVLET